jgi:hypothetical protein
VNKTKCGGHLRRLGRTPRYEIFAGTCFAFEVKKARKQLFVSRKLPFTEIWSLFDDIPIFVVMLHRMPRQ